MKEGLEEFLKRIEARPTNETLIDRFVTLVLEENGLERIFYLKKLVALLLSSNPYAALKAAALELQEARKEKLDRDHQIAALIDVESCFLKLDKEDNALMVREEITKLQNEISRESQSSKLRPAIPDFLAEISPPKDYLSSSDRQQPNQFKPLRNVMEEGTQSQKLPSLVKINREFDDTTSVDDSPFMGLEKKELRPSPHNLPDLDLEAFTYAPRLRPTPIESPSAFLSNQDPYDNPMQADIPPLLSPAKKDANTAYLKFESALEGAADPFNSRSIAEAFAAKDFYSKDHEDLDALETSKNRSSQSQQAHFPESNLNRSVTRREPGKFFSHETTGSYEPQNQEGTEILTGTKNFNYNDASTDEQTARLEIESTQMLSLDVPSLVPSENTPALVASPQNTVFDLRTSFDLKPSIDLGSQLSLAPASLPSSAEFLEVSTSTRDSFTEKNELNQNPVHPQELTVNSSDKADIRWHLLSERLRLLSGIQVSRAHALSFMQRSLGETAKSTEVQSSLGILENILDEPKDQRKRQQFLVLLFEDLPPKNLHQLLATMKIGDQSLVFFTEYLDCLLAEQQFRRALNVIHAIIIAGLDMCWYTESFRLLAIIWPLLGLKGWYWTKDEGSAVFCIRLSEREDLLPATLLA